MEECLDENIQNKIYLPFLTQQNFENKQQNANNNYFYKKCFEFSEIEENLIQQNNLLFDSNSININNLNKQKELCSSSALKITKKTVNNRGRRGSKRKNNKEFRLEKPKKTYIELIAEAINKQILNYNYLREYYECFRGPNEGWKNCIRHNLSLGSYFEKLPKNPHGKIGKGHLWTFGSNYNSLIEEKQKNLISNSKRISTSTKSKTTKNNKSELINKQINEEIDNNNLLIENNSNMNNIKICSSNQIIISNNLKDNQQQLISSQINSDLILFSSNTENNENYLINFYSN
ncbi:Fork-head domain-containing protein [Meloidogyne graminicola]|uniref:Fork-head domain-containing protein n=1 Tax=Meloidogyne graminicola TaxID=189291 RepID=A0A8S9ZSH0_9BILA|nr:Fork-head domain-containing protein [Meloidogyne graminicola]